MDDVEQKDIITLMDEAVAQYKAGNYVQAFTMARGAIASGGVPQRYSFYCMWMAYRYLRQMGASVPPDDVALCIRYFRDHASQEPSLARSVFLQQMIELSKSRPDVAGLDAFAEYGVLPLRDDDFQRREAETPDGRKIQYESLAEKLATRLYNLMKSCRGGSHAAGLMPFFRQVEERCPWNKYIKMYIGLIHYWGGNADEARRAFRDILLTAPEWYIWKNMALVTSDPEEQKAFCCKAVRMSPDEKYSGGIHLQLASMLAPTDKPLAAAELARYIDIYRRNNWRIPSDALRLHAELQSTPLPVSSTSGFYDAYALKAEQLVYGGVQPVEMTYLRDERNAAGKRRALLQSSSPKASLRVAPSQLGRDARPGDVYSVRYTKAEGRCVLLAVSFLRRQPKPQPAAGQQQEREVEGRVSLPANGAGFAFIAKRYFVPDRLRAARQLQEGQMVKAVARQAADGRWRVVKIL